MSVLNLSEIIPGLTEIDVRPIGSEANPMGWWARCLSQESQVLGQAIHRDQRLARIGAMVSAAERELPRQLVEDPEDRRRFDLELNPGPVGFAFGFDPAGTRQKAVFSAIRAWCWSKWTDEAHQVDELLPQTVPLTPLAEELARGFERVYFFRRLHSFFEPRTGIHHVAFQAALAQLGEGLFVGSTVRRESESAWEEILAEATLRREQTSTFDNRTVSLEEKRQLFFSRQGVETLKQARLARLSPWPAVRIRLFEEKSYLDGRALLVRALADDHRPLHEGDETRFVWSLQ